MAGEVRLNFCVRELESGLNPTCARRQADTHSMKGQTGKAEVAHSSWRGRGSSGVAVKEGADRGDCRVQVPPPSYEESRRNRPDRGSSGVRRSEKRRLGLPQLRAAGNPAPPCAEGRAEREPRGLGERRPGPSPAPFLSPLHSGEPHFLRAAAEGAARGRAGEGAAGASAGSALFSAARPERAARPATPARAHLLDGRHRVPALGHPGGEVGGGG